MIILENIIKGYLTVAAILLALSIIALFHLKPGSPSFIINIFAIILLLMFIAILLVVSRKITRYHTTATGE